MIDINLLPPERRPAKAGVSAKPAVVILLLALIPLGAAVAGYAYSILPALEKERNDLAAVYESEYRQGDPARLEAAGRLLRDRMTWARALTDVKAAINAAAGLDGMEGLWLNRFRISGSGFEMRCRVLDEGFDVAEVENISGAILAEIRKDSLFGALRSGAAVREDDPPVWRFNLSGTINREQ